jgi:hypothetical protein
LPLDNVSTQGYTCVEMIAFDASGKLPPGIHETTWKHFCEHFGVNPRRVELLVSLKPALDVLASAGCETVYIDGSFVTTKPDPGDIDVCWDPSSVDIDYLNQAEPSFFDFRYGRAAQKTKYQAEFFPSSMMATDIGKVFLEFFQLDKETGNSKGIVAIDLRRFKI